MTLGTEVHPEYVVGTWKSDAAHQEISFTVRHLQISKVRGEFRSFEATVVTAEHFEDSTVEATIDVASVDTNQEYRDNHLRSGDFFLVEEYPTATFKSTSVSGTADDFSIVGDLTIRGVTKSETLKGEFGGVYTDGQGNTHAGITAKTVINRMDYGVKWNGPLEAGGLTLGNEVTLSFDIEFLLQK